MQSRVYRSIARESRTSDQIQKDKLYDHERYIKNKIKNVERKLNEENQRNQENKRNREKLYLTY